MIWKITAEYWLCGDCGGVWCGAYGGESGALLAVCRDWKVARVGSSEDSCVCAVVAAFSASTLAAMLACVSAVSLGLNFIKSDTFFLRRWGHAIAGAVILLCALALFFE